MRFEISGTLMQHDNIPVKSENQIDFLSNTVAGQSTSATVLIKVHGNTCRILHFVLCFPLTQPKSHVFYLS